jgi:hypothetical protein
MPVILGPNGKIARQVAYEREEDFERDVVLLADQIFGPSVYVDIKRRVGTDILMIPDGYLIDIADPADPRLFIVENEIVGHDPFRHIGIQMLKFVTSFDDAQRKMRAFLMENIRKTPAHLERLTTACKKSASPNIDHYLDRAVYRDFRGLVVIDEARPELYRVLEKINADISVLELKVFETDNKERFYLFSMLYDDDDDVVEEVTSAPSRSPEERTARRLRRRMCDTIIVPAREEGFQDVFLGQDQWYAIRIGAGMKDRIRYIAAYRVAPISAVTHIAEVAEIKPYKDTGKYMVIFKGPAQEIAHVPIESGNPGPQGPVYARRELLLTKKKLEDVLAG